MISTILVEHPWLTTVALAGLLALGPLVGAWAAARPRAAYALAALASVPVVVLTLFPTRREVPPGCYVEWSLPTLGRVELMANVVLFVAPVLLLAVASRRPVAAVLAGSAASVAVEAVQAAVDIGRSCSTNDWLANTLGAVLGGVLAVTALGLTRSGGRLPERLPSGRAEP